MMKMTAADLRAALKALAKFSPQRPTIPILSHVLIAPGKDVVNLIATDLDAIASREIAASGKAGAPYAVSLRLLAAFAERATGEVTMKHDAKAFRLNVSAGRKSARIPTLPGEDFPSPTHEGGEEIPDPAALARALAFCAPAASADDTRHYLCGAHVCDRHVAATDGAAMHVVKAGFTGDAIIPDKVLPMAIDAMAVDGARAWISDTFWRVESAGAMCAGKLVEGAFPDISRIIPANAKPIMECLRDDLSDAIRSAALASGAAVELDISRDAARIRSRGGDKHGYEVGEAEIDSAGDAVRRIILGSAYLDTAVMAMPAGPIVISQAGEGDPVTVTSPDAPDLLAVIMPMRK